MGTKIVQMIILKDALSKCLQIGSRSPCWGYSSVVQRCLVCTPWFEVQSLRSTSLPQEKKKKRKKYLLVSVA